MIYLVGLSVLAFLSLLFLVLYDALVKPYLFSSSTTRDELSTLTAFFPESFSIASEGLPAGFVQNHNIHISSLIRM